MLIESDDRYTESLVELWKEVFGDSEEYIRLFFKNAYYDSLCFAETEGDRVISAFYLLGCTVKFQDKSYNGHYLYAAATLPEYRGKGLMSKLINEAIDYAGSINSDFIALVPADDGLYDYYGRFGFAEAMYKYKVSLDKTSDLSSELKPLSDSEAFGKIRNTADCNMLVYNKIGSEYAFDCLRFSGTEIYSVSDSAYYAEDEEFFSCSDDFSSDVSELSKSLDESTVVYTNCPIQNAVKVRNGMIYNLRNDIEFKDIYMNIALD